jgi:hypothetical protein
VTAARPRYDRIGAGYARTRRPDPELRARIEAALGDEAVRPDPADGSWDARRGHRRSLPAFDAGMRLVVHAP